MSDELERRRFTRALLHAAQDPAALVHVVIGVRADFYNHCAADPDLARVLQDQQVLVGAMTEGELRRAVEEPAARVGLALEPGLVQALLQDAASEPGSLPLLSHALLETWRRRRGRTLTLAGYREAGGVRQAIARTAERVYEQLNPGEQTLARRVFVRLTALGDGTDDTRRRVARAEFTSGTHSSDVESVLDRLARARLLTLGQDTVEVAHEALIREWPRLRGWLADDRDGLRLHRRLTQARSTALRSSHGPPLGRGSTRRLVGHALRPDAPVPPTRRP